MSSATDSPTLLSLAARLERTEKRCHRAESRLRQHGALLIAGACLTLLLPLASPAIAQGYGTTLAQLLTRVIALETKTQFVSVTNGEMFVTGTNLHIESGSGATNGNPDDPFNFNDSRTAVNSLGNLIIGYNETIGANGINRQGSHNLIIGVAHDYSSFGGLVAGEANTISAPYATVSGGFGNTASGIRSSVSGGDTNVAGGRSSTVSGGQSNDATGDFSSVSGGLNHDIGNAISNFFDWKAGGLTQDK